MRNEIEGVNEGEIAIDQEISSNKKRSQTI